MLDINELRNELPKIGDVLIKIPVTSAPQDKPKIQPKAYACVVRYVHPKNLWYQVEFNIKGNKFKQSYNLIDDDYNKEMHEYWVVFTPRSTEQCKIRRQNIKNADKTYDGNSSCHKKTIRDSSFKSIFDIVGELENYNKKHKTNLSYGQYVGLIYEKENKKNEYI